MSSIFSRPYKDALESIPVSFRAAILSPTQPQPEGLSNYHKSSPTSGPRAPHGSALKRECLPSVHCALLTCVLASGKAAARHRHLGV